MVDFVNVANVSMLLCVQRRSMKTPQEIIKHEIQENGEEAKKERERSIKLSER